MTMAKRHLLVGALVCLVLGVADSVFLGIWFTRLTSRSPIEAEAPYLADVSPGAGGGETRISVIAPEKGGSVSHPPHLPFESPSGAEGLLRLALFRG
ncbi:MAG: hypothetical protein BECKG1743D_GA0114223_111802 [Candidatus Kentron sp. G]|nr:MAG: hypothetical protein BECKG1743D_GA0114223_111802 [Candidatus Kentron sp. G]